MGAPPGADRELQVACLQQAAAYAQAMLQVTSAATDVELLPGVGVQELRQHVVEVVWVFAAAVDCPQDGASLVDAVDCFAARLHHAARASAWRPWGSPEAACWTLIGELLVHSWDLAPAAVGLPPAEPSACAHAAVTACEGLLGRYRQLGTVGPSRIPHAGCSELDRLAALYGRTSAR